METPNKQMSIHQQVKASLKAARNAPPEVLHLDEATRRILDQQIELRQLILEQRKAGEEQRKAQESFVAAVAQLRGMQERVNSAIENAEGLRETAALLVQVAQALAQKAVVTSAAG